MNRLSAFFAEQLNQLRVAYAGESRAMPFGLISGDAARDLDQKVTSERAIKKQISGASCTEMKAKNEQESEMIKHVLRGNMHL